MHQKFCICMKSLFAEKLDLTSKLLGGGGMVSTAGNCVIFRDEGNGSKQKDERRKRKEMMMTAFPIGQWLWHSLLIAPIIPIVIRVKVGTIRQETL